MKALFTIIGFCAVLAGQSQTVSLDKLLPQRPFIEVVGTAIKDVSPDKIVVSIILSEKNNDNGQNNIQNQEKNLKAILTDMNVAQNRLFLSDASSEIIKDKRRDIGVKVSQEYSLELKTADEVTLLFRRLAGVNIKECSILRIEHSKIDSIRKDVRIAAIKAAKDKAEYLLAAIGEQIDKALEIREESNEPIYPSFTANQVTLQNMPPLSLTESAKVTDFRTFKIKFSYYIKYAIK